MSNVAFPEPNFETYALNGADPAGFNDKEYGRLIVDAMNRLEDELDPSQLLGRIGWIADWYDDYYANKGVVSHTDLQGLSAPLLFEGHDNWEVINMNHAKCPRGPINSKKFVTSITIFSEQKPSKDKNSQAGLTRVATHNLEVPSLKLMGVQSLKMSSLYLNSKGEARFINYKLEFDKYYGFIITVEENGQNYMVIESDDSYPHHLYRIRGALNGIYQTLLSIKEEVLEKDFQSKP